MNFTYHNRQTTLQKFGKKQYDIVVIGGGITGAGIALDASLRGLKVALFEKHDFAYGTSSRSTKLIHGGLRYLKQLEFGLVKEVGSERAIVHKLAPHLVIAEKMLLPLNEGRGMGSLLTSFGLKLYDWLAGVKPEDQRRMLTRKQTLKAEPLLKPDDIKGSGLYAEYRTDDARLTIEIMKTAASNGADILNYCEVKDFIYDEGKITHVRMRDLLSRKEYEIRTITVINATGPWVDDLREIDKSKKGKQLHLTKGVHIVVAHEKLPIRQAIYFDVPDGRMIFAIPRGSITYIGTTDTDYHGKQEDVLATNDDAVYLLNATNATFPTISLQLSDIESSWAGLRPLIHEEGKSASELSRKDEIFVSDSGLISMAGGKLTGYRKMAERVVDLVIKRSFSDRNLKDCHTAMVKLSGGEFRNAKEVEEYASTLDTRLKSIGLDSYTKYMVYNYGRQSNAILDYLNKMNEPASDLGLIRAELWFCVHHEMVVSPLDFLVRRTGMLFFDIGRLKKFMQPVLDEFKKYFAWDDAKLNEETKKLNQAINEATLRN
jgi:glycerol-3-phosphate dehydrogenase